MQNRDVLLQNLYAGIAIVFKQLAMNKFTDADIAEIISHLEQALLRIKERRKT